MIRRESDVCIIGGGISAALLAQKLSELRPNLSIRVIEAGKRFFDLEKRYEYSKRQLEYNEKRWPGDAIPEQLAEGVMGGAMAVGGWARHLGGSCRRLA